MTFDEKAELEALEKKYPLPVLNESLSNVVLIDQLPRVDEKKAEKLMAVLKKSIFSGNGTIQADGTFMPLDKDSGLTKGFLFVELENKDQADAVIKVANGYRLDKQHTLLAFSFSDFDRLTSIPEEFKEPEIPPYKDNEFLGSWLQDPSGREQFFAQHSNKNILSLAWANRRGKPELFESREKWSLESAVWSSHGTMLATLHEQGVALFGGATWRSLYRFPHHAVKKVIFSPCDTYMVTWSKPLRSTEPNLLVWKVRGQVLLKGFYTESDLMPLWSADERFLVRRSSSEACYLVYDLANEFAVLDKHTIPKEAQDVHWSPKECKLAYWLPETPNLPVRVCVFEMSPTRQLIKSKNIFNVKSCSLHWQDEGKYLAIAVARYQGKSKNLAAGSIEVMRLRERGIPVDVLDVGEEINQLHWEPSSVIFGSGNRLVVLQGSELTRTQLTFYTVEPTKDADVKPIQQVGQPTERRPPISKVIWSPRGEFILLCTLRCSAANFEVYHVGQQVTFATCEHVAASNVFWDADGGLICSAVTKDFTVSDNGIKLWSASGQLISSLSLPSLRSFQWRPRPPLLLDSSTIRETKKNLRPFIQRYEAEDAIYAQTSTAEEAALRLRLLQEWLEWRNSVKDLVEISDKIGGAHQEETGEKLGHVEEWLEDQVIDEKEVELTAEELADFAD